MIEGLCLSRRLLLLICSRHRPGVGNHADCRWFKVINQSKNNENYKLECQVSYFIIFGDSRLCLAIGWFWDRDRPDENPENPLGDAADRPGWRAPSLGSSVECRVPMALERWACLERPKRGIGPAPRVSSRNTGQRVDASLASHRHPEPACTGVGPRQGWWAELPSASWQIWSMTTALARISRSSWPSSMSTA